MTAVLTRATLNTYREGEGTTRGVTVQVGRAPKERPLRAMEAALRSAQGTARDDEAPREQLSSFTSCQRTAARPADGRAFFLSSTHAIAIVMRHARLAANPIDAHARHDSRLVVATA
ncbi:MAG: hypothetical protein BRD57_01340, partial [Proteobacteria bacterium SW_6_67_9]